MSATRKRQVTVTIGGRTARADVLTSRSDAVRARYGTSHPLYKQARQQERQDARDQAALALHEEKP